VLTPTLNLGILAHVDAGKTTLFQPQTRILMRALQRLAVPTLLYVNKIDRTGADVDRVLASIRRRLTPHVLLMGRVVGTGTRTATFRAYRPGDPRFAVRQVEALAEHDDELLARTSTEASARRTGCGPSSRPRPGPACCTPRTPGRPPPEPGSRSWWRGSAPCCPQHHQRRSLGPRRDGSSKSGTLGVRSRLDLPQGRVGKATGLQRFDQGRWARADSLLAGQIGRLTGLSQARVGDGFGRYRSEDHHFATPTLEAAVTAVHPEQGPALRAALAELSDSDPLIAARSDDDGQAIVSLYGRVQQEVIADTLVEDYGIQVEFADAAVLHVERPRAVGAAVEWLNTESNLYHATIGLSLAPGRPGSGVRFVTEVTARDMPLYLFKNAEAFSAAIERHVLGALAEGRYGWRVTDCVVTLTHCGYSVADGPPSRRGPTSTSYDYRQLTPIVVRQALRRAGTVACEPVLRVQLEIPNEAATAVQRVVTRWGAEVLAQTTGEDLTHVEVRLVSTRLHELQRQLPDLTGGEGVLEFRFDTFEPVRGHPPVRRVRST
jgi:ribosomal protection tetracycline resistance protein